MTTDTDWVTTYLAETQLRRHALACVFGTNKPALLAALAAAGVDTVEYNYEGMGDSGAVEQPDFFNAENKRIEAPVGDVNIVTLAREGGALEAKVMPITEALEDLIYLALEANHPGWEINEGSFGTLRIEVAAGTMTLCHSHRSTDYSEDDIGGDV